MKVTRDFAAISIIMETQEEKIRFLEILNTAYSSYLELREWYMMDKISDLYKQLKG